MSLCYNKTATHTYCPSSADNMATSRIWLLNIQSMNPSARSPYRWKFPYLSKQIAEATAKNATISFIALTETWLKQYVLGDFKFFRVPWLTLTIPPGGSESEQKFTSLIFDIMSDHLYNKVITEPTRYFGSLHNQLRRACFPHILQLDSSFRPWYSRDLLVP